MQMKTYQVECTEVTTFTIKVAAQSQDEARDLVNEDVNKYKVINESVNDWEIISIEEAN